MTGTKAPSKFKPALATNLHADNYSTSYGGEKSERFAVGFDYEGARYHIWFKGGKDEETLYKNPPLDSQRGQPGHFDTRRLWLGSKFGLAVLDWIAPQFNRLLEQARAKFNAEVDARLAAAAQAEAEQRVRDAAPAMLKALRLLIDEAEASRRVLTDIAAGKQYGNNTVTDQANFRLKDSYASPSGDAVQHARAAVAKAEGQS